MEFDLENHRDFWRIHGVNYRDSIQPVDLSKKLLRPMTQNESIIYSINALQNNRFRAASMPLYHSVFTSLFRNIRSKKGKDIEKIRKFLYESINNFISTLTRVEYNPSGIDKIIHNCNIPGQYEIAGNFVGPDEFVKNTSNQAVYKALLGTDDTQEINEIYKWICGNNPFLWRVNHRPENQDICVAGFGASSGADLWCCGDPRDSDSALGVRDSVSAGGAAQNSEAYTQEQISTALNKLGCSDLEKTLISELTKTSK